MYNCFSLVMIFSLRLKHCVLCTFLSDQTDIWDGVKVRRKVILQAVKEFCCCWEKGKKKVLAYLEESFILGKHPSVILVQYRLISLTSVSVFSVTCLLITKYICCTSSFQPLMSTIAHLLCLQNQNPE